MECDVTFSDSVHWTPLLTNIPEGDREFYINIFQRVVGSLITGEDNGDVCFSNSMEPLINYMHRILTPKFSQKIDSHSYIFRGHKIYIGSDNYHGVIKIQYGIDITGDELMKIKDAVFTWLIRGSMGWYEGNRTIPNTKRVLGLMGQFFPQYTSLIDSKGEFFIELLERLEKCGNIEEFKDILKNRII